MQAFVTSKNVKWCHLIWPTLYIDIGRRRPPCYWRKLSFWSTGLPAFSLAETNQAGEGRRTLLAHGSDSGYRP